jgi:hypothetical protein
MIVFLVPMILSNVLQALFGTINNVWASSSGSMRWPRSRCADELLRAGQAQARGAAADLTGIPRRHSLMVLWLS